VNPHCSVHDLEVSFERTALYDVLDTHQNTIRLVVQVPKRPDGTPGEFISLCTFQFLYFIFFMFASVIRNTEGL
jgi:hypothetical protein